jgi:SAM-dependent methyltransferase
MIDVSALMARLTEAELLDAADAYFSGLTIESEQCYKPFSNIADSVYLHRHLSLLLQSADLFRGADVLDFGCATGWLTLSLASLGCNAVGVDVAGSALALAGRLKERHGVRAGGSAAFLQYKGSRLPLGDESMDRVVCFDAFHHVRDQAATLAEFARVLRPGGRVAMLEPGPNHSKTAQSQMEMSRYKVIENDIDMKLVSAAAVEAGLQAPTMLVQMPVPIELPVNDFLEWDRAAELPKQESQRLLKALAGSLTNTQSFFIVKPGSRPTDSRQPQALAATLRLVSAKPAAHHLGWELVVSIKNTGEAVWRTQPGAVGRVNLGVQLIDENGVLKNRDYFRAALPSPALSPGDESLLEFVLVAESPQCCFSMDLVAEHVCWFSEQGRTQPLVWGVGQSI